MPRWLCGVLAGNSVKCPKYERGEITQFSPDSDSGFIRSARSSLEIKFKASRVRPPFDRKNLKIGQQVLYSTRANNRSKAESVWLLSPDVLKSLATGQVIHGRVLVWKEGSAHGFLVPLDRLGSIFAMSRYPLKAGALVSFCVTEKAQSILAVNVVPVSEIQVPETIFQ